MATASLILRETALVDRKPDQAYELFADPQALLAALGSTALTVRQLSHSDRWVLHYPEKIGDKVIDLHRSVALAHERLGWLAMYKGFEVETAIRFEAKGDTETRLRIVSKIYAKSLRAKLLAPILKLGERRIRKKMRRSLRRMSEALRQG